MRAEPDRAAGRPEGKHTAGLVCKDKHRERES